MIFDQMLKKHVLAIGYDTTEMWFVFADKTLMRFYHEQDCCENVDIEDVCGDVQDLCGGELYQAEQASSNATEVPSIHFLVSAGVITAAEATERLVTDVKDNPLKEVSDSGTWTFYRFAGPKGSVVVRWLGESNGYYSESVDHEYITEESAFLKELNNLITRYKANQLTACGIDPQCRQLFEG